MLQSKCAVCKRPAEHKCAGCFNRFYCTKEHQISEWKNHKKYCKPFKVSEDEILGRHLVATRPIKDGEIILREPPIIRGPFQITVPVCLGCGKMLKLKDHVPCAECGWPMCSENCSKAPCHIPECHYTANRGDKISIKNFNVYHPSYQCIVPLRCLYEKQFSPENWKVIDRLESHCSIRKGTSSYEKDRSIVVNFIRKVLKLGDVFSEEDILRACGIIMVNGHEVPLTDPPHVALYEIISMIEHNCRGNCCKSFTSNGDLLLTAGRDIKKGEHLSICYTDPLWGTQTRRYHLNKTKFFWCACERCSDPTELGTYYSAVKCKKSDCAGFLLPKTFLVNIDSQPEVNWSCTLCENEVTAHSVHETIEYVSRDLDLMDRGSFREHKKYLEHYGKILHKNHFFMVDPKMSLIQLIGQQKGGLAKVTDIDLELKVVLCKEVVELVKRLLPAEKRIRGAYLFELHAALTELSRRSRFKKTGKEEIHKTLLESKSALSEVIELLQHEPSELPEGKIFLQAKINLDHIDNLLAKMSRVIT